MDAFVAEDASLSHGADAEEVNNGSYRREDESDDEGQENKEENVMEEEERLMMELQINTSTTMTSEISSSTYETCCEDITTSSKSEQHVTSSSIDKSEVDRMRELNERLGKTIASLENKNESLRVEVERLTKKEREISSISWEEEKTNRAEIKALEEKNKSYMKMLTDLEERLEKEINVRIEAEKKLRTLERVEKELNLENKELKNKINTKEETISKMKETYLKEKEQILKTTEITRKGGFNVDAVDGVGFDLEELEKRIFKSAEENFTDIKVYYKTKMEELAKTVTEKEAELAEAREENIKYAHQIEDYEIQISSFKERLAKADTRHSEDISRLNKEIQKSKEEIKAMKEKIEFNSQTVKKTTKMELDAQLIIYEAHLDHLEGRIKSHKTDESAGGEKILKTEMETKQSEAYSHQEIHHSQETETSVSQQQEAENQETKYSVGEDSKTDDSDDGQNTDSASVGQTKSDPQGENEGDNQGHGGSPGTMADNQGWNGTKDWPAHFKLRQTLQVLMNPGSPEDEEPKSDPEADNQEDDQGRKDNGGDDDSDENNSTEIPLDMLEVPRDAIPRRQPRFAFRGTRSEFFEQ